MELGAFRFSFYGNCADHAVNIHITEALVPEGGGGPLSFDVGDQCVAARTVYEMGLRAIYIDAHYVGTETGAC